MTNQLELVVTDRRAFADGHSFGEAGAYERLSGRALFAVDPLAPAQADVVDLQNVPRDADRLVRFAADFTLLKPVDAARWSRRLLYDYGNRGHKRALQFFNDAPHSNDPLSLAHAGNGFLMRRGHAVAWLAWEGDLLPGNGRMILDLPVATGADGPITGRVRTEIIVDGAPVRCLPLSGRIAAHSYPTVSRDTRDALLTRRRYPYDVPETIPPDRWSFSLEVSGLGAETKLAEQALIPSDRFIHYPAGFQPGWIYELLYTARDPKPMGLGHVAVRDFISFLRNDTGHDNPLHGLEKAYAWGRSQTGRCLRDFVYRGYNADAAGRRVFDGVMPHVAGAGRKWLNHRFATPIVSGGQHYEDHFNVADAFPFAYARCTDHLTGQSDAILKRPETDPLVFHTQTATEYWVRRGSLVHTDTHGNDLPQPPGVRIYAWAGSQHSADPLLSGPQTGIGQQTSNVVATSALFRAMLDAMDAWATDGTTPPDSQIPTRGDGTLVPYQAWRTQFPAIPGVAVPTEANPLPRLDYGPDAARGILREPPVPTGEHYPVFVPAVDDDGNEVAGVRAPMVAAPLATHTGWNLRSRGYGSGVQWRFEGSTIPFPETTAERIATGDPRPAILERYADKAAYVEAIIAAARTLVEQRLLLEEDVARAAEAAADWGRPRHAVRL